MRAIIFSILCLFIPTSFACDVPYEQIGDYKLGCPFIEDYNEFQFVDKESFGGRELTSYSKKIISDNLFDEESIIVIDGNIEAVVLSLKDEITPVFVQALFNRWGKPVQVDPSIGNLTGLNGDIVVLAPENSVIGNIVIEPYSVSYGSKIFARLMLEEMKDYSKY